MKRYPLFACLVASLFAWQGGLGTPPAGATTVKSVSVAKMASISELVFVGRVVDVGTRREQIGDGFRIWTDVRFDVEQVLRGQLADPAARSLAFSQIGGAHGEGDARVEQVIWGYPTFSLGERVVVFLERTDTGRLVVTGLAQGKYTVHETPDGTVATRDKSHIPDRARVVRALRGVPADESHLPLASLIALVRGDIELVPLRPQVLRPVATPQVELAR